MSKMIPGPTNRLLDRLPATEFGLLAPHLQSIEVAVDTVLYQYRGAIDSVYFPTGMVGSALTVMEDGTAIEVATVGNEGLVGHMVAFGGVVSSNKVVVQVGGVALRMAVGPLVGAAGRSDALRELLIAYHAVYMMQVSQSVACNGLHRLEQRCCRWLLMTRDRVGSDNIQLTHEYLSIMLGSRRASVTDVLKSLQEAGLVRSQRGKISLLDGPGLEARCCECYRVVKAEYDLLLDG